MTIAGEITEIFKIEQISKHFKKCDFVIKTQDKYPQHIIIQLSQDRCRLIEKFKLGDIVSVSINIKGRKFITPQGYNKYNNTIDALNIELIKN